MASGLQSALDLARTQGTEDGLVDRFELPAGIPCRQDHLGARVGFGRIQLR
jgi:hypothetical protein